MQRPLIARTPEARQRLHNSIAVAAPIAILGIMFAAGDWSFEGMSWWSVVGSAAMVPALFLFVLRQGRRAEGQLINVMREQGFTPYYGEFSAGLERWPGNGFPLFEDSPWAVGLVFDHAGQTIRTVQGSTGGSDTRADIAGAAIRVPEARFPAFSIQVARRGLLSSTPPSTATFRDDREFAEEYAVMTDEPRQLERALDARVLRLWRTMPGWQMQGSGQWVIIWQAHPVTSDDARVFVDRLRAMAEALREGVRSGQGTAAVGR